MANTVFTSEKVLKQKLFLLLNNYWSVVFERNLEFAVTFCYIYAGCFITTVVSSSGFR